MLKKTDQPALLAIREEITREMIRNIQNPSDEYIIWADDALRRGTLEGMVDSAISNQLASDVRSTLQLFNNSINDSLVGKTVTITKSDYYEPNASYARVQNRLKSKPKEDSLPSHRRYGQVGHEVAPLIATNAIPQLPVNQRELFFTPTQKPSSLFDYFELENDLNSPAASSLNFDIQPAIKLWEEMKPLRPVEAIRLLTDFRSLIKDFFQPFSDKIYTPDIQNWFELQSLRTWLGLYEFLKYEHSWAIAPEILASSKEIPVPGGRIDAIRANYEDEEFFPVLSAVMSRVYNSAGELLHSLKALKKGISCTIYDWKYAIGDNVTITDDPLKCEIRAEQVVKKPFSSHSRQVKNYIVMATWDYFCISRAIKGKDLPNLVSDDIPLIEDSPIKNGVIAYLFPNRIPILHEVQLSPEETRLELQSLVKKLPTAQENATNRCINNLLCKILIDSNNSTEKIQKEKELQLKFA